MGWGGAAFCIEGGLLGEGGFGCCDKGICTTCMEMVCWPEMRVFMNGVRMPLDVHVCLFVCTKSQSVCIYEGDLQREEE
jgi:hypothetical protein